MLIFLSRFTSRPENFFAFGREHVTSSKLFHSAFVRPPDFYESFKTCCRIPEEEGHSSPYIPGRLSSLGCNSGGSCEEYSAGSNSPSVPRFYNKPQEIITDSNTSDNLSWFPNRLIVHDDITPGRKGQRNCRLLSPSARFSKYHIAKPSKFIRSVRVFETSHLASSTSLSSLTVRSVKGPKMNQESYDFLTALSPSARVELAWWLKHPQCKR